ncbi:endo alpha-1,4 polygalactosaminidase [Deinococcus sonorensis]|uniref:Endo alpha-1,4 polygalactosaminidase n=2 Tax=Deinococcus sonorensis TaxID=309891 RepID=A0AAU7U504_9DEIO
MTTSRLLLDASTSPTPAAGATRVPPKPLAVYYGHGSLQRLSAYRMVVLHPQHYTPAEILWLKGRGVKPLAYLSVGEDPSPEPSAWSRRSRNPAWNTWYVKIGHPAWNARLYATAAEALQHFDGLLLDTLDSSILFPTDRSPLLRTLRSLRQRHPDAYFLANRGFDLLPDMARYVNGVLMETFTTSWEDGYRKLRPHELAYTAEMLRRVRSCDLEVYALDYATTDQQRRAARVRARALGLTTFVSVRELNSI